MVGAGGGINTEGAEIIEMPINGRRALYYENMGMRNVFWNGDYYSYRIYADDVLSKEEVIKIAKSVKVDFVEK